MPDAHTLLESLHAIANTYVPLAVAWHGALAVYLFIALGLGKEPRWRLLGRLLALPVASVSILAWLSGNPFNGTVFGALTVFLLLWAQRLRKDAASPALSLRAARGLSPFMLAYAAAYPHFVNGGLSWLTLLTAPLGVLPCPTISLLVAAGLFSGGFGSRSWSRVVAATGLAYAVLGILVLGVWLMWGSCSAHCCSSESAFAWRRRQHLASTSDARSRSSWHCGASPWWAHRRSPRILVALCSAS